MQWFLPWSSVTFFIRKFATAALSLSLMNLAFPEFFFYVRRVIEYLFFPFLHFHHLVEVQDLCCTSRSPVNETEYSKTEYRKELQGSAFRAALLVDTGALEKNVFHQFGIVSTDKNEQLSYPSASHT